MIRKITINEIRKCKTENELRHLTGFNTDAADAFNNYKVKKK